MTVDIDKVALDAARSILGVDGSLPLVQRKARIQCIVIDALNGAPAQTLPMAADIAQIISNGWLRGKSALETAEEILREFDVPALTSTDGDATAMADMHRTGRTKAGNDIGGI